jgi:hypothetical protein
MKRMLAGLLTVIIMSLMIGTGLRPKAPHPVANGKTELLAGAIATPTADSRLEDASSRIESLLDCARRGDVAAYLGAFGGPLRARLDHEARQRGWSAFGEQLRRAGAARRSHALFAEIAGERGADAVRVTVESVYADRVERQAYRLTRDSGAWLVSDVDIAHDATSGKRVGTLATFEEPEGVPVAAP